MTCETLGPMVEYREGISYGAFICAARVLIGSSQFFHLFLSAREIYGLDSSTPEYISVWVPVWVKRGPRDSLGYLRARVYAPPPAELDWRERPTLFDEDASPCDAAV